MARGVPSSLNLPTRGPGILAPQKAATPPMACTTPEPAKSMAPCPHFGPSTPSCDSHPPPQTQLPKIGYSSIEANRPQITNDLNRQRSAIAPVGIVAVASMN